MARLTLAVTSLLCFLIYSVHASKLLHAFMGVLHQGLLIIYVSTIVAAPGVTGSYSSCPFSCALVIITVTLLWGSREMGSILWQESQQLTVSYK